VSATAYDARVDQVAIRDNNPVYFFETQVSVPPYQGRAARRDYTVPMGKRAWCDRAACQRDHVRRHVLRLRWRPRKSWSKEGIELEIVDLRTVLRLDRDAIRETVEKTSRVIVLHETTRTGGIAGEVAAIINEECFDALDAPIARIASADTPVPFSPPLESGFPAQS